MSNAEARSWWADVQHLRPDAPAGPVLLSDPGPEPADDAATIEPLLTPERGRRFVRAASRPAAPQPPGPGDRDRDRGARRIVLLADDDPRAEAPAQRRETTRPETQTGDAAARADRRSPRAARAAGGDVDFDFGRATEDRARRRTAERLGTASGRARDEAAAVAETDGVAAPAGPSAVSAGASAVSPRPSMVPAGPSAVSTGPSAVSTGPSADSAGPSAGSAGRPLVPLAPPPTRRGLLARPAGASRTPGARPRRPRGSQTASQPDRIALWAVVLGILLIALAAASSRAEAATHAAVVRVAPTEQAVAAPVAPAATAVPR